MSRFFVEPANIKDHYVYIDNQEDINHIKKVLRLSQNDTIMICDGHGKEYKASIEEINHKEVKAKMLEASVSSGEPSIRVTLYQGIPKAAKMEYIIQKVTELGIENIVPVMMHRTVVKFDGQKGQQKKVRRWQRIAYEAAKQSNRGRIPKVFAPISYDEAIGQMSRMDIPLIPYEQEQSNALKDVLKDRTDAKSIGIMIGPEGGFDDEEVKKAKELGLSPITLGPRILRTETAGMAVLAILMYVMGEV